MAFCIVGCTGNNGEQLTSQGSNNSLSIDSKDTDIDSTESSKNQSSDKESLNTSSGSNKPSPNGNTSNSIAIKKIKIDTLDKLNFYAVKKAIAQDSASLMATSVQNHNVTTLANNSGGSVLNLANSSAKAMNPKDTFTITMYSYFTVTVTDPAGFLAQKLGGTGLIEVVITKNNFNNMITFKKGDKYYSCVQSSLTDRAISFSTHNYISGYNVVSNNSTEKFEYVVYLEGDKVADVICNKISKLSSSRYGPDDIKLNDGFSFVINKKQSFTAVKLESICASNNAFVDNGIVLEDGTVLFAEASVTDNSVAFKNNSGTSVISNSHIKKVTAMQDKKLGYCIKLELTSSGKISGKTDLDFYFKNSKVKKLTLQGNKTSVYITNIGNKSSLSDIFNKLTTINTDNRIGKILDCDDFMREMSKRLDFSDYEVIKEDRSQDYGGSAERIEHFYYTCKLKTGKSISPKKSNYDITIDDITFTMPIKVSDLLAKGFTEQNRGYDVSQTTNSADFISPQGNLVNAYVSDVYNDATDFYSSYVSQITISCQGSGVNLYSINPSRPDYKMFESISKDSTVDDIIAKLGEPNTIYFSTLYNLDADYRNTTIQLLYDVKDGVVPEGILCINCKPVLEKDNPVDFITNISYNFSNG